MQDIQMVYSEESRHHSIYGAEQQTNMFMGRFKLMPLPPLRQSKKPTSNIFFIKMFTKLLTSITRATRAT